MPPPPPPPPPPAPPPTFSLACTEKPTLNKSEQSGRQALLSDICKTRKLKTTVTNDRSAPVLSAPKGPGGGGGASGGGGGGGGGSGPAALGGLFAGGMPKLRSAGARDSSDSGGGRPPLLPPGGRSTGPRPFAPNNAPPRLPVSSSFPKSSNAEPPRNKFPPASQPKLSRPDIGSKSDAGPPPVPNAPRPSALSTQNRGPPAFPGNRPANTGPSLPNRNPGSSRHFSPIPPPSNTNRSYPTPSRFGEDKPSLSTPPTHNTNRPPLPPTPARVMDDRPPPPPMMNRPNRDGPPLPPPQHQKPPVPQTPRPSPSFQTPPPPPPPNRPGPPHSHPGAATDAEVPRLPQRNLSLHSSCSSTSPGPIRSGPLPPSERPPPPIRDPPSRSGPLPPPPPGGRNGSSHKAPPVPQPPSRMGSDNLRSGFKPPLPPDRGSPVSPPTAMRNGFQEPPLTLHEDEWEGRFSFHSISELPPPEPYINFPKTYPSKQSKPESRDPIRRERGAPPLPPIPPTAR